MLSRAEFLKRVTGIQVSRKGGRTALYKPLLLLVLLGRTRRHGVSAVAFSDIEAQLKSLIAYHSADDSPESVGQPWWHLPTDSLWQVRDESGRVVRESGRPRKGNVPSIERMRRQSGEFPDDVATLVRVDNGAAAEAIQQIVTVFFPTLDPELRDQMLNAAGADWFAPAMRERVGRPFTNIGILSPQRARDPFEVDPDEVDRANQAHAETIDALAEFLRARGIEPRRPRPDEPLFDLAWEHEDVVFVAEAKSITFDNEEKQLRLGLGQVLRYRQLMRRPDRHVVGVLVPQAKPRMTGWADLCDELDVYLTWPGNFTSIAPRD